MAFAVGFDEWGRDAGGGGIHEDSGAGGGVMGEVRRNYVDVQRRVCLPSPIPPPIGAMETLRKTVGCRRQLTGNPCSCTEHGGTRTADVDDEALQPPPGWVLPFLIMVMI